MRRVSSLKWWIRKIPEEASLKTSESQSVVLHPDMKQSTSHLKTYRLTTPPTKASKPATPSYTARN
ncbi:unnamed protein product [Tenebrio molitor]|nr:unnamed protein product [Tenebrio molitor]